MEARTRAGDQREGRLGHRRLAHPCRLAWLKSAAPRDGVSPVDMGGLLGYTRAMKRYKIVVKTFEEGETDPVVVHELYGSTPEEARGVFQAHMKSDAFLRDCIKRGLFAGRILCRNEVQMKDSVDRRTVSFSTKDNWEWLLA